jgi:hypothetical protein
MCLSIRMSWDVTYLSLSKQAELGIDVMELLTQ